MPVYHKYLYRFLNVKALVGYRLFPQGGGPRKGLLRALWKLCRPSLPALVPLAAPLVPLLRWRHSSLISWRIVTCHVMSRRHITTSYYTPAHTTREMCSINNTFSICHLPGHRGLFAFLWRYKCSSVAKIPAVTAYKLAHKLFLTAALTFNPLHIVMFLFPRTAATLWQNNVGV